MQQHGASLGFSAAERGQVATDNILVQFLANTSLTIESFSDAVVAFRQTITEGDPGEATPVFPAGLELTPPAIPPTVIWRRVTDHVARIRAAAAYTPELGAEFQIVPKLNGDLNGGLLKPVIKVTELLNHYKFSVSVSRFGVPNYKIQIQRDGQTTWQDVAFADSNPCKVMVTPTTPGAPERILVRAVLIRKNEPVGEPSDPTYVTVNA